MIRDRPAFERTLKPDEARGKILQDADLSSIAEILVKYRENRYLHDPGYDIWLDEKGSAYVEHRLVNLCHIEEIFDMRAFSMALPEAHLDDEAYEAQRECVVEWTHRRLNSLRRELRDGSS